jgi:uncharacterized iron-regulated protein
VLVGEAPGNVDHARLAARLVRELAGEGRRLAAVALAPLPSDSQPAVTEYMARHPGDAAGLAAVVREAAPDRPQLARLAPWWTRQVAAGAQLVAPDLPPQALRGVLTHGLKALQPAFVQRTGLTSALPAPLAAALKEELSSVSCERVNGRGLDALVRARRARDANMADRLAAITGRGQSVLVAEATHVRKDRGVPWYLARLRPAARVATLAFVELPPADGADRDAVSVRPAQRLRLVHAQRLPGGLRPVPPGVAGETRRRGTRASGPGTVGAFRASAP